MQDVVIESKPNVLILEDRGRSAIVQVIQASRIVEIPTQGIRGPPGRDGRDGSTPESQEVFFENVTEVLVIHGMNRKVFVSIFDPDGMVMYSAIDQGVPGQFTVRFTEETSGSILWL